MDLTLAFNAWLKDRGAKPVEDRSYDIGKIDLFLQEAYSIHARIADLTTYLRSIRASYLSTAPPPRRRQLNHASTEDRSRPLTDQERDSIDASSKQLLRQLNGAITGLKQAEDIRNETATHVATSKRGRQGFGGLARWAAGGAVTAKSPEELDDEAARNSVAAHRESVIFFLQRKLEEAGRLQSGMMEVRLNREIERSKSVLYKSRVTSAFPRDLEENSESNSGRRKSLKRQSGGYPGAASLVDGEEPQLSQEQLQIFEEENNEMLKHYEDTLDQVRTAEKSILEISELHSTLHANLEQQSEHVEQMVQDSYLTTENLDRGNKELKKASERKSTARMVCYASAGFCTFLVAWDLIF